MLLPTYKTFQLPAEQRKALFGSNSGITTKHAYSMHVQSRTHTESSEVGGTVINCTTQTQGPTTVENFFLTSHTLGYNIKVLAT